MKLAYNRRMTQAEKDGIRSRRLERYQRAVDDYNNHCKRLDEYVDTMRDVVRLHDDGDLHAFMLPNGEKRIGVDSKNFGIRLPSHDDMADAVIECRKARQERDRLHAREQQTGTTEDALDAARQ